MTDILLTSISKWPAGVFADPTTVEGRAAWYSFAFWLRLAAGAELDVDALELQSGFRSIESDGRAIGQAFLSDALENGAGYSRALAEPSEFLRLLAQADPGTPGSVASKWTEREVHSGSTEPHGLTCDTSCNRCLRDFHNQAYHGLLDWRLALDMARLAASASVRIDLDGLWGNGPNPWTAIVKGPGAPVPAALQRLGYASPMPFGTLRGYVHTGDKKKILIERHPMWQSDHEEWLAAEAEARATYPGFKIDHANPFRILRRPADYV